MTTIAVTGATGFVGGHVVRHLAGQGHRVLAFGRRPASAVGMSAGVTYHVWDITRPFADHYEADAVVHCAGSVTDWGRVEEFVRVNVDGTKAVLRAFADASRFVYVSTASIYDPFAHKHLVREDAGRPARYLNGYAYSKMLAEEVVRSARPDAVILRPHAVYGRGERKLLPRLLKARVLGWQIALGDGRNHTAVTHISNLVQAIGAAIDGSVSGTFNIADDEAPTVDELLRSVLRASGLPERIVYIPASIASRAGAFVESVYRLFRLEGDPRLTRYIVSQLSLECTLDTELAKDVLGYRPRIDYRIGIADALGPRTR